MDHVSKSDQQRGRSENATSLAPLALCPQTRKFLLVAEPEAGNMWPHAIGWFLKCQMKKIHEHDFSR